MDSLGERARTALAAVLVMLVLMGCTLEGIGETGRRSRDERIKASEGDAQAAQEADETKAEADQVLAAGQVLSVRINFGKTTATQVKARLDNPRNGWYDYVEEWTEGGSALSAFESTYVDFPFGSTNFNRQLTEPDSYDPKDANGEYTVTVTANDGYSKSVRVRWDGQQFQPNLLSFSLD